MFNLHDFIMSTIRGMIGHYPDFQIREYALSWYSKGKLEEDDLAVIEEWLSEAAIDAANAVLETEDGDTEAAKDDD